MSWMRELSELRRELRQLIMQSVIGVFGWTLTAASSSMSTTDEVETGDGEQTSRPIKRLEPFGLRSRRPSGLRALWAKIGSSNVAELGLSPSGKYGPQDLENGETVLYNTVNGTIVKLDKDGNVTVSTTSGTIKIATSGNVELGPDGGPNAPVLILGSMDSMGVPVTQAPAFSATKVKAG